MAIRNYEVARILYNIAVYLDMQNEQFKPRAYEKAARSVEALTEELDTIYAHGGVRGLMEIPGVGENIAKKIEELIKTGKLKYYQDLKKKIPVNVEELAMVEGVGPKTIKILYEKLKVKNMNDLEKVVKSGKISRLPHFGEKSQEKILKGIRFLKLSKGRMLLGNIFPIAKEIERQLQNLPDVEHAILGGSARRMKETVGDLDFLVVTSRSQKVMDFFVTMPEVIDVISKGTTKSMVRLKIGIDADLRVVPPKSFGAALQYFTGNKDHNIALRKIAMQKKWKLSEYGIFDKSNKQIAGKTEEEVYGKLGLQWMPPEMRENTGEIDVASRHKIPKLIEYGSLKGDLQTQTNWTDGSNSIMEMAEAAKRYGLEYIVVTDHTKTLAFTGGLDEKKLERQRREIDKVNKEMEGMKILQGAEVNIMKNGALDIADSALKKLDIVGAAVHTNFNLPKDAMTKRIVRAIENPNVDILFHPTGRVINQREPYQVDIEKIINVAKSTGTVLEIDAFPERLDLKDEHVKLAKERGCKFSIDSDAHSKIHFHYLDFGIGVARRGWLGSRDVVNTLPLEKMLRQMK